MNLPTHPVGPEEVMAFLDGELSPERTQFISAHVNECVECREVVTSLRKTSQSLSNWTVPSAPANAAFEDRVCVATKTSLPDSNHGSAIFQRTKLLTWRHWVGGLAVTAALAMVLLIASVPVLHRSRGRIGGPALHAQLSKEKAMREVAEMDLPPSVVTGHVGQGSGGGMGPVSADAAKITVVDGTLDQFDNGTMGKLQMRQEQLNGKVQKEGAEGLYNGWILNSPMIARTVSLSIVVKDFDVGRVSLDGILARHSGYTANLNVSTPQGAGRAIQASLRIPAPQLVAAVSELKALGRVEGEAQNGEEVTQQHTDLVARLKNSRETEQRLQDMLRTRTGKVKDVLEVEEEIARVRGEIEQMEAEQKTLEHRVEFATIDLKLGEEYKAQLNTPAPSVLMQLRNASINGFRNAFEGLLALVLFLAESGPSLLLWLAILGVPAWKLWRRYRRAQSLGSLAGV
jgi:uncharacterized protein DUF4349/putative zinc finger protein